MRKLERVGDRTDLAVPLRALRDEITLVWTSNPHNTAVELVEPLFMLFDRLEFECRRRSGDTGDLGAQQRDLELLSLKEAAAPMRHEQVTGCPGANALIRI